MKVDELSAGTGWGTNTAVTYLCPGEALGSVELLRDDLSMWKVKKENRRNLLATGSSVGWFWYQWTHPGSGSSLSSSGL